jgi:hypothetical protein
MNAVLNKDIFKTIPDAPLVDQDASKTEPKNDVECKKAEALKRIDAFIDRHEPLLVKLAK